MFFCNNYSKMPLGFLFGQNPLIGWLGRGKFLRGVGKLAKLSGMPLSICAKLSGRWMVGPWSLYAIEGGVKLWRQVTFHLCAAVYNFWVMHIDVVMAMSKIPSRMRNTLRDVIISLLLLLSFGHYRVALWKMWKRGWEFARFWKRTSQGS